MSALNSTTRKRRRASDGEVIAASQTRRKAIEETTKREHSKRKWVDDHDDPIGKYFSKKPRVWSFQPADIQWTRGRPLKNPFHRKRSPYLYQWLPRRPPWYTSRVYKRYVLGDGGRPWRRRVGYSEGQVQGLENWLSKYEIPFNAFCVDEVSASLLSLSLAGPTMPASEMSNGPVGMAVKSAYQPRMKEEEEEEL